VRGASALGQLLADARDSPLAVVVVWEPVIESDLGPPTDGGRAPLADPRVTELWDPEHLASRELLAAARADPEHFPSGDTVAGQGVAWDLIALFPPGARWEARPPRPDYFGAPVVEAIAGARRALGR